MEKDPIVICSATRTPIGAFQGVFSPLSASDLGAVTVKETVNRAKIDPSAIDECYMGCVLPAGQGQAPARQAAIKGGVPESVPCTTLNKMCGSGMKAVMMAYDSIAAGTNNIVLAGGIESMTNAPYILEKARQGYRMGHGSIKDHMFHDGLEDAYDKGKLMGYFADQIASQESISREEQDAFALQSLERAVAATQNGYFTEEIAPVEIKTRKETIRVIDDETPTKVKAEKIPQLKPAFTEDGSVTAANASSISDGASSIILARKSIAETLGMPILAIIHGHSSFARKPSEFCLAPIGAMEKLKEKVGWGYDDVDLFEINEAFAMVTLAAIKQLNIPEGKVNIHGGACALGHPVGATGARIITTLIYALKRLGKKKGVASLCIGGGEATAMALEIVE